MCGKIYYVIACIMYAWLEIDSAQGIEFTSVRINTEEATTDVTTESFKKPVPFLTNVTEHEGKTSIGTTGHGGLEILVTPKHFVTNATENEDKTKTWTTGNDSLMEIVQHTMYMLCPYGQFCRSAPPNMSSDEKPCCTDCSCNENCSDEENKVCCFPKTDLPETDSIQPSKCLAATFSQGYVPDAVPRYNMVTDCPSTYLESLKENKNTIQSCKDDTLVQSLRPVFSKTTKLIYKNKFCAQCHEETRFISWTPYLICTGESIQVDLSNGFLSSNCYIRFKYPGDLLDIQFHRCCLPTFSHRPNELSLDRDTVVQLCEHSIYAPFSYMKKGVEEVFVNIYCAMCSSNFLEIDLRFKCKTSNIEDPGTMGTYIGILDVSLLHEAGGNRVLGTKTPKMEACKMLDSGEQTCRELFCKSGQVLNQAGQCVYVSLHWLLEDVHVLLKLSYDADIPDCSLYSLFESNELKSHLKSSLLTSGDILKLVDGTLLCNCTRWLANKCDPHIMVVYSTEYYRQSNETFPEFLNSMRKLLSEPWYLEINGSSLRLTPELLNLHSVKDDALWYLRHNPFYMLGYVQTGVQFPSFQITKLFYCEQISLHELEYDIYTIKGNEMNYKFIYTPEQGKVFFPHEYTLHKRVDGSVFPKVCVTDTLFQKVTKSNDGCQKYGNFSYMFVIAIISYFNGI